jgi:hypothetical protein
VRKIQVAGIVLVVALIAATAAYFVIPSLLYGPACGGGVYDAKTSSIGVDELGQQLYNVTFTKNGVQESGLYYGFMSHALSWIKANTPSDVVFMSWWDYGKEIVGCTGRTSVISNPSARFIALGYTKNVTERDPDAYLTDVGTALFTTNATLSQTIAAKYGAGYLLVTTEDGGEKAPYILQYLGLKPGDYMTANSTTFAASDWTSLGQQTLMYKLLSGEIVSGFTQVYSDNYVRIFSVG